MSLTPPSFDQAEYNRVPEPFRGSDGSGGSSDSSYFVKAISFGLAGVIAGALVYAGFIIITHIQIGYLAIGVAYLVAKAMMLGSGERGGLKYQITAIVLTCCSVALGNALMILWQLHKSIDAPISLINVLRLLPLGFEDPFLDLKDNLGSGLIGLFILFIGFRAAWRMTSGAPGASHHPFRR